MTSDEHAALFTAEARRAGFHRVGFAPVGPWERHAIYRRWLDEGKHGEMDYLATDAAPRRDPALLLDQARTVVTVALSYAWPDPPVTDGEPRAFIARYARGADYHMVMKARLNRLAAAVEERLLRPIAWRSCVDTAPLLEREAAHRGGIGFLAKNTMIIAPGLGSYVMLGELLVDVECAPSGEATPKCGQCRACLDACPTGAFTGPYSLDARRCISYLTIEARGPIPRALRPLIGNMVFGCDRCQEVCPFNAGHAPPRAPEEARDFPLAPLPELTAPSLSALLSLGAARFRKLVRRTALRRIHRAQLLRNVAVALGNTGGESELPALGRALAEPTALVRSHVVWAIGEIGARHPGSTANALLSAHAVGERDSSVIEELESAQRRCASVST